MSVFIGRLISNYSPRDGGIQRLGVIDGGFSFDKLTWVSKALTSNRPSVSVCLVLHIVGFGNPTTTSSYRPSEGGLARK